MPLSQTEKQTVLAQVFNFLSHKQPHLASPASPGFKVSDVLPVIRIGLRDATTPDFIAALKGQDVKNWCVFVADEQDPSGMISSVHISKNADDILWVNHALSRKRADSEIPGALDLMAALSRQAPGEPEVKVVHVRNIGLTALWIACAKDAFVIYDDVFSPLSVALEGPQGFRDKIRDRARRHGYAAP